MAVGGGRVVSVRFPYLPVVIEIDGETHSLEALLDTGFDGDIILPLQMIGKRNAPDGHQRWNWPTDQR
ncbi:MAG: hypothetical protein HW416_1846 [Chloroflexi bacterium]|nr:hypothetical protein [Chloroflexota bacterium]